jgi:hypothetical protein
VGGTVGVSATAYAQTLLDDTTATEARATLGLTGLQPTNGAADTVPTTNGTVITWAKVATANIATDAVDNTRLANVATQTIKGRTTASTGDPEDLTATQATAILNNFVGDSGSGGTKGLVPAPLSGDSAAGKVLAASGSWVDPSAGFFWAKIGNSTVINIATTVTATINRLHLISGTSADYDITLPSASVGDVIGFMVNEYAAATKQFRLDATGSVLIAGRTKYLTLLHTNTVLLMWSGSAWRPLVLSLYTPWVEIAAPTIFGTITNPAKGVSTIDRMRWRRMAQNIEIDYRYYQPSVAGTVGSGDYYMQLPIGQFAASTVFDRSTSEGHNQATSRSTIGRARLNHPTSNGEGDAIRRSATTFTMLVTNSPGTAEYNWSAYGLNTAFSGYNAQINAEITNW